MTVHLVSNQKIAETASKGNQEKWLDSCIWYKLDQFGYEALAEVFTSQLLEYGNIEAAFPFTFVRYQMERLQVHGRERTGCSSRNFLQAGESIVTLAHLFLQYTGKPLSETLNRLTSDKKRMAYLAEETANITGLSLFPQYLTLLFEIDGLVLNDDRHLNNIAVLARNGTFDYCPIFDFGAGLLSNTRDYPMEIEPDALVRQLKAQPMKTGFIRQVHAAQNLYEPQLRCDFAEKEIMAALSEPLEFYAKRDVPYIRDRVTACIKFQRKKLF